MGFLIAQVLFCLLLAAAIGLVVGWLIRRFICQNQVQALEAGWSARLSRLETQRDELAARMTQLERSTTAAGQATSASASVVTTCLVGTWRGEASLAVWAEGEPGRSQAD